MGVVNLSIIQVYWSSDWFIQSSTVWKNVMSRESFLLLQRFWHFDNPNARESRLQKISPLMDHFNQTMGSIYCKKDLSFHESMVLRRSCLKFRLYIKGKRHKYGVKLYELCESTNLIMRSIDKIQWNILSRSKRLWSNWSDFHEFDEQLPRKRYTIYMVNYDKYLHFLHLTKWPKRKSKTSCQTKAEKRWNNLAGNWCYCGKKVKRFKECPHNKQQAFSKSGRCQE